LIWTELEAVMSDNPKVVPIWMRAVESTVEKLIANKVRADEVEAAWELLEGLGPEAVEKAKELYEEKRAEGVPSYRRDGGYRGPQAQQVKAEVEIAKAKPSIAEPKPKPDPEPRIELPAKTLVEARRVPLSFQHSRSPTGIPASLENAIIAIDAIGAECRYDVFHDRIIVKGHECGVRGDAHENLENVTLKIRQAVLERFGFDPSAGYAFDALKIRCLDHIFDPVRDYVDGLEWDGIKRLDTWLVRYCKAKDTPLNRAIGRKMLVAAVRRVREPGCKFDYIVVLEGEQGVGKSSLLRVLAGEENFSDNEILGLQKREQQEAIQGVWIYEVAELDGLSKSEVTRVKLFASKTVDGARPAYGRSRVDRPRRCIFVATTNEDTYLRDTTGNRRFWPVQVGVIDLVAVRRDRDQLWAEAAAVEAGGEPLVIGQELWGDVAAQQQARMELDPWEDILLPVLGRLVSRGTLVDGSFAKGADANGDPEWRVSTEHLLTNVLSLPKERQNNNHTKRLAAIMRGLGWARSDEVLRFGKEVKRGFTKPCG
jgi:predicted P-loop ATPase